MFITGPQVIKTVIVKRSPLKNLVELEFIVKPAVWHISSQKMKNTASRLSSNY